MESGCRELLIHAKHIHDKYVTINQHTGEFFNVFQVLNVHYKEVPICRVLYELLSPEGSHGQGVAYLEIFMKDVLCIDKNSLAEDEWRYIKVERERVIDSRRRIDLVIETPKKFIPIEVKIYAGEQEQQCLDYYNYANRIGSQESPTTLFYLTRFGTLPTNYSTKGDKHLNIKTISFADHILPWLKKCLQYNETWRLSTVSNTIYQLIDAIKIFTCRKRDLEMEELAQYLRKSKGNLQDALYLESAINFVRQGVLRDIFQGVERIIDNSISQSEKSFEKNMNSYYVSSLDSYRKIRNLPCLEYSYVASGARVSVKLEVDWRMYISFTIEGDKKIQDNVVKELEEKNKELLNTIYIDEGRKNDWRYLENKIFNTTKELTLDEVPNFIEFNEAFYRLLDDKNLQAYIIYCANAFLRLLNLPEVSKNEKYNETSN